LFDKRTDVCLNVFIKSGGVDMDKDDLWIVEHFSELVEKYAGKAIAVVNEQLVAVGNTELEVELIARQKYPDKIPSVLTVPREEDMACLL
jgi:hypothetical protein